MDSEQAIASTVLETNKIFITTTLIATPMMKPHPYRSTATTTRIRWVAVAELRHLARLLAWIREYSQILPTKS
jgi:hypothetical protein